MQDVLDSLEESFAGKQTDAKEFLKEVTGLIFATFFFPSAKEVSFFIPRKKSHLEMVLQASRRRHRAYCTPGTWCCAG